MTKQKKRHQPVTVPKLDPKVGIADVPVKIAFLHGGKVLKEYDDVIDLEFSTTAEGLEMARQIYFLTTQKGHSTESALFTIASEQVRANAQETIKILGKTMIGKRAAGHEIHVHVKRNGDITFRAPILK